MCSAHKRGCKRPSAGFSCACAGLRYHAGMKIALASFALLFIAAAAPAQTPPVEPATVPAPVPTPAPPTPPKGPRVLLATKAGTITIELARDKAQAFLTKRAEMKRGEA